MSVPISHWKHCSLQNNCKVMHKQLSLQNNKLVRSESVRCPWLLAETKVATILGTFWSEWSACASGHHLGGHYFLVINLLVRAECVRCPWLLAQTKVATILGTFFHFFLSYLIGPSVLRAPAEQTKVATVLGILVRAALCRRCLTAVGHYWSERVACASGAN